jgi:hypothetical protein
MVSSTSSFLLVLLGSKFFHNILQFAKVQFFTDKKPETPRTSPSPEKGWD